MTTHRKYLIVRADGSARIVGRVPHNLNANEVAYPLTINVPDTWARVIREAGIEVNLPDPPPELTVDDEPVTP